jgi:formiminotetrahydrofolate cyclodeaminase
MSTMPTRGGTVIREQKIRDYLDRTASHNPTPGGGAAGALQTAQGAALIAMAARFTTGEHYAGRQPVVQHVLAEAQGLVTEALDAADADAEAFGKVAEAYAMNAGSEAQKEQRSAAIQQRLQAAAEPPLLLVSLAGRLIALGEELADCANPNVLSDIAAAAAAARAAAATAQATLDINLASITDGQVRTALAHRAEQADLVIQSSDRLAAWLRTMISNQGRDSQ